MLGGVERPEAALFDKDRDARPDQLAVVTAPGQFGLQCLPVDLRQRPVEQQRVVARIVDNLGAERAQRPVKRHLRRGDQVAPPHGHAVEIEPVGDRVDQPFAHKAPLKPPGRAIGRRRRLVGQAEMAHRAIGRDPVGTG